jgi:RNase P/RNase MRP subunit POP5
MIEVINRECENKYKKSGRDMGLNLIRFNGKQGILRCNHIEKENAINLLTTFSNIFSKKVEIKTIGTSGTIKSLINKHLILNNFYENHKKI